MDNKLNIRKEAHGRELRISLEGRLDANWAGHLDDYLNGLVRDGSYRLLLDLSGVQYLSSAGIRILINQYKKVKKIGGLFVLENLSTPVSEVLRMVGMIGLLTEDSPEVPPADHKEPDSLEWCGYRFSRDVLQNGPMTLSLSGDPALIRTSAYSAVDNRKIRFSANRYGLGIGAIGDGFDDCKSRYGEFLAVGEALVYKPSDGSKVPDYTVKTGRLEPEINALYSIQVSGDFSDRVTFDPLQGGRTITLESLAEGFGKVSGHGRFAFLMIAESGGLVGVSLNAPPVAGNPIFDFPHIRENINFTTEPAYSRMLTVTLGICSDNPDGSLKPFVRPASPQSPIHLHAHTAVFPYQALSKKETSAGKLVRHLFETSLVEDVLHLVNDSREINGLGDSTFKQGVAWIGKI
jgi:anti-anti-sigma factor